MNLLQLQEHYWWLIDDSTTAPRLITATVLTKLINDARKDIADRLDIVTEYDGALSTSLYPSATGSITLPSTAITVKRFEWGSTKLEPIHNIQLAKTDSATVDQYMFMNRSTVQLFGSTSYQIADALIIKPLITAMLAVYGGATPTIAGLVSTAATYAVSGTGTPSYVVAAAATAATVGGATAATVAAAAQAAADPADAAAVATGTAAYNASLVADATALEVVAAAAEYITNLDTVTTLQTCVNGYAQAAIAENATTYSTMLGVHTVADLPKAWVQSYPADLVLSTDSPSELPEEYHECLVTLYVRAKHAAKMGWNNMSQGLLAQWEDIKNEVAGKTTTRQWPENYTGEWEW